MKVAVNCRLFNDKDDEDEDGDQVVGLFLSRPSFLSPPQTRQIRCHSVTGYDVTGSMHSDTQ